MRVCFSGEWVILADRSHMLQVARAFFLTRGLLEADCSALIRAPSIDTNIDVMSLEMASGQKVYLHTSPEYAMKRLLAAGSGDLFYLGHVFRYGEIGPLHSPEFTMAEWYRLGFSLDAMIQETAEFISLFVGPRPMRRLGYRDAFRFYVQIDPQHAPLDALRSAASFWTLPPSAAEWDRETYLYFLLTHAIEPKLGRGEMTVLTDYPPHQAALARLRQVDGEFVAERFEIYVEGVELCNGYHELTDATEQRRRFQEENRLRRAVEKEEYPQDEELLRALELGLPDCSGVAVGFDRLMMLRHDRLSLKDVLASSPCCSLLF